MKEVIYSISDVEIGDGSETDDFYSDELLAEKISWMEKHHKADNVYLVVNGDGFEFAKTSYKDGKFPRAITKDVSLFKLEKMFKAHKKVFAAYRNFAKKKKNTLVFIFGNHDMDLAFVEVQERMRKMIHPSIVFPGFEFERGPVRVEHGSQHDLIFYMNPDRIFLNYRGKKVLNLPWMTYALFESYNFFKIRYPLSDTIYPRDVLSENYPRLSRHLNWYAFKHLVYSAFVNQVRYFHDLTYRLSFKLIAHFIYRVITGRNDVIFEDSMVDYARNREDLAVIIGGHSHVGRKEKISKKQWYLNSGTWRDEYVIDAELNVRPKEKHIAEAVVENGRLKSVDLHTVVPTANPKRIEMIQKTFMKAKKLRSWDAFSQVKWPH